MAFFWKVGVVFQQPSNRRPERNYHSMLFYTMLSSFIFYFYLQVICQWTILLLTWRRDAFHACAPLVQLSCDHALRSARIWGFECHNSVDSISATYVLFLLSFMSSFVLAVKPFIHVVTVYRILMLFLYINIHIYIYIFVISNYIPRLKKKEERKEARPVTSWENRKHNGLVTLKPFLASKWKYPS